MIKLIILLIVFSMNGTHSNAKFDFISQNNGERQPINSPIDKYDPNINSYPDPFSSDKIIFTINQNNYTEYAVDLLTPGQLEMFKTYPETFKMHVYQSRRSCAVPQEVIELTVENAELTDEGEGIKGVVGSIPFPNPSEALHHVWNHILRYRGVEIFGASPFYIINSDGSITYGAGEAIAKNFWNPFSINNKGLQGMIMTKVTHPPRLADASALVIESLNAFATPRRAWVYNPGTRRVRRAPDIAYDYKPSASQGLTTTDQFDGFNGAKDRYNWSSKGKQLRLMPYNAYKFHETPIEDILTPYHVNQDYLRYELVNVNVVQADLKSDKRHILPHRTMYFDLDSHNMIVEETFDDNNNILAYREFPIINYYDQPMCLSIHSATYDFSTRRYQLQNVRSIDIPKIQWRLEKPHNEKMFTPEGLKRFAR
ncbi:DUF1329 domain-containing protein [Pelagibacteraceae bacterium]|nr:DUF1329 domain-containing protein [Pelagibacteraceae bacterium]